jgi:hypothetical protein
MNRLRRTLYLALLLLAVCIGTALAASFSLTYTAAQDTQIQTKLIPLVNTANCAKRGLGPLCTSANLVTKGCVAVAFPAKNMNVCTIYTADAAGEAIYLKDTLDAALVTQLAKLNAANTVTFQAACRARTPAQQDAVCVANGQAAGCNPCP